jgi:hypothetical protein
MDLSPHPSPDAVASPSPAPAGEGLQNPATGRLSVQTVECLHRLLAGDPHTEAMVLQFIGEKYGAQSLLYLPPHVASAILKRSADFLRAVKDHCEPEFPF